MKQKILTKGHSTICGPLPTGEGLLKWALIEIAIKDHFGQFIYGIRQATDYFLLRYVRHRPLLPLVGLIALGFLCCPRGRPAGRLGDSVPVHGNALEIEHTSLNRASGTNTQRALRPVQSSAKQGTRGSGHRWDEYSNVCPKSPRNRRNGK